MSFLTDYIIIVTKILNLTNSKQVFFISKMYIRSLNTTVLNKNCSHLPNVIERFTIVYACIFAIAANTLLFFFTAKKESFKLLIQPKVLASLSSLIPSLIITSFLVWDTEKHRTGSEW
ncbi:hypothetical protein ILUMI_08949, partial [Ignelater luminosus]